MVRTKKTNNKEKKGTNIANERVVKRLKQLARLNGYEPKTQYMITTYLGLFDEQIHRDPEHKRDKIGVVDMVWLKKDIFSDNELPVYAFEIETGWRNSNTLRADISKMKLLNCVRGFIVYPRNAFNREEDFSVAKSAIERYSRILGAPNMSFLHEDNLKS